MADDSLAPLLLAIVTLAPAGLPCCEAKFLPNLCQRAVRPSWDLLVFRSLLETREAVEKSAALGMSSVKCENWARCGPHHHRAVRPDPARPPHGAVTTSLCDCQGLASAARPACQAGAAVAADQALGNVVVKLMRFACVGEILIRVQAENV
jgi:hypothetical protein